MKMYELKPSDKDGKKSFYHKAMVMEDADGNQTLFSYLTPIITRKTDGEIIRHWNGWSTTTGRHIASFCGLHKRQFLALPVTAIVQGVPA